MVLALVLCLGASARALSYRQVEDGPLLHLHVWTESDMHFYDR